MKLFVLSGVVKSRILRRAEHLVRMEEGRNAFKISTGTPTGKRPLGKPRRIWEEILEWILKKYVSIRGIGLLEGPCECGIDTPGSISHGVC